MNDVINTSGQRMKIGRGWLRFVGAIFLLGTSFRCADNLGQASILSHDETISHKVPPWISQSPMVFIGNWDAMPIFRRRVGGNPVWQEDQYYKEHTEKAVKGFRDMGVTMALIHFYKGFGLEAEKEHIEEAKKLEKVFSRVAEEKVWIF